VLEARGWLLAETADDVGVFGKTRSGTPFSAHIEAGVRPENVRFSFEVRGSTGWLNLASSHPFGFKAGDLKLTSNVSFVEPDAAAPSLCRQISKVVSLARICEELGDSRQFSISRKMRHCRAMRRLGAASIKGGVDTRQHRLGVSFYSTRMIAVMAPQRM
jgi:hypothetical protein